MIGRRKTARALLASIAWSAALSPAAAEAPARRFGAPPADVAVRLDRLVAAYPDHLESWSYAGLRWRDGTLTPLSDGRRDKSFAELLATPDLDDLFAFPYPDGAPIAPPGPDQDPGRIRPESFFTKMYGDCHAGEVEPRLREIVWLPSVAPQRLRVTTVNGVADRLERVSAEIEALPERLHVYATPSAGTYNCRAIAGTVRPSVHAYGAAIDLNVKRADYWRWAERAGRGEAYVNRMPAEIVAIFERHGFIWGGRWRRFDTMHFEYRPELAGPIPPRAH
ncbi:MAG: M15 family metallopeptidase [Pseudomonadota bacterium]